MMKMTCWSGGLAAGLALLAFNTHAVTIDFQTLEHVDAAQAYHGTSYTEDGFTLSGVDWYSNGTLHADYRGSTALLFGNQGVPGTLAASGGGAFNLFSIDLAEVDPGTASVSFTGYLLGGGSVTQKFILDGSFGTGFGFQTFAFSGFTNVTSVVWSSADPFHQFDNIVASTVPIPAAAWLLGSGLLGLLGVARRRST
jgi:hypothetical protein